MAVTMQDFPRWPFDMDIADGYSEKAMPYNVSFAPERGPAITRRGTSVLSFEASSSVQIDHNQLAYFEHFYDQEIGGGALPFYYIKKTTNERVVARLKDGQYQYSQNKPFGGILTFTLEILPQ